MERKVFDALPQSTRDTLVNQWKQTIDRVQLLEGVRDRLNNAVYFVREAMNKSGGDNHIADCFTKLQTNLSLIEVEIALSSSGPAFDPAFHDVIPK